jgi:hypothetical protein
MKTSNRLPLQRKQRAGWYAVFSYAVKYKMVNCYSTVTDFARLLGSSTSQPLITAL